MRYILNVFNGKRYSLCLSNEQIVCYFFSHHTFIDGFIEMVGLNAFKRVLWTRCVFDGARLSILMNESPPEFSSQGEACFSLWLDGRKILTFSFIVVLNSETKESFLYVTRMQGGRGAYDEIRKLNKWFYDMNSSYLIISALEGFCRFIGIVNVRAVSGKNQLSYRGGVENFTSTYDGFFKGIGAQIGSEGDFQFDLPLAINSTASISGKHRSRHKKHVAIRKSIELEVFNNLQSLLLTRPQ